MNCRSFLNWLETGPVALRREAELHAASCPRCAAALRAADEVEAFLSASVGTPAEGLADRVIARLPEPSGHSSLTRPATLVLAGVAAALAVWGVAGGPMPTPAISRALGDAAGALARMGLTSRSAGRILAEASVRGGLALMLLPSLVLASRAFSRWISSRIAGEPIPASRTR